MALPAPCLQEVWSTLLQGAPVGLAILGRDMRYLQVSERWLHDYGLDGQDIIGRSHHEVFPFLPARWKDVEERGLAGIAMDCEADPLPCADGSTMWVRWEVRPWHLPDGDVGGIIIFSEVITRHLAAERAVRDSEARYRALIEQAPEAVLILDLQAGRTVHANAAARRLFGADAEEITRRGLASFYANGESDCLPLCGPLLAPFDGGGAATVGPFECRIRNDAGEEYLCEVTLQRLPDAASHVQRASFVDVTARWRAEELLRQEEAKYRGLVEQQIFGLVIIDTEQRLAYINPHFAAMAGWPSSDLLGRPVTDIIPTSHYPRLHAAITSHLQDKAGFVQQLSKLLTRSGASRDVLINATRSTWLGRPASAAVVLDVTEQQRAALALRRSEEKYRQTVDMAPVGIVHVDAEGRFLMVNPFFCNMIGYSPKELLGMSFVDVTVKQDIDAFRRRRAEGTATRAHSGRLVKRYCHRNGRTVWAEVTWQHETDPETGAQYTLGIINDITAHRQAETERMRLAAQLQQSQKMEAIGQLTGGLAHDFNNLLAVIIGNLDFLRDRHGDDAGDGLFVSDATQAALRGAELTQSLLAFARRQPLAPKLADVADVLDRTTKLFQRTLGEQITLRTDVADALWPVMIDVPQLESALLNLAVNGRDAMVRGGTLSLSVRNATLGADAAQENAEASPGEYVIISVSDTGGGMTPDVASRAFEPFFTTKGTHGSGLGLSMVHGFVKQSGGHTLLYSEPGRGTTVDIYLPRADTRGVWVPAEATAFDMPTGIETVLAVEDNESLRRVAVRRLGELGYHTIEAHDAAEALVILHQRGDIHLLFTDVVLPGGMDGVQLADAACDLWPGLKVLFTSGFSAGVSSPDGHAPRGPLLRKPYRKEELARRVRTALDGIE